MQGTEPPSKLLEEDEMLNFTAAFDEETWESTRGALQYFEAGETTHSRYGYDLSPAVLKRSQRPFFETIS